MTNLSLEKLKVFHKFTIYNGQTLPKLNTNCLETQWCIKKQNVLTIPMQPFLKSMFVDLLISVNKYSFAICFALNWQKNNISGSPNTDPWFIVKYKSKFCFSLKKFQHGFHTFIRLPSANQHFALLHVDHVQVLLVPPPHQPLTLHELCREEEPGTSDLWFFFSFYSNKTLEQHFLSKVGNKLKIYSYSLLYISYRQFIILYCFNLVGLGFVGEAFLTGPWIQFLLRIKANQISMLFHKDTWVHMRHMNRGTNQLGVDPMKVNRRRCAEWYVSPGCWLVARKKNIRILIILYLIISVR